MPKPSPSITTTVSTLSSNPPNPPLRIHFPSQTVTTPGTHLTRAETSVAPTFSISAQSLNNLTLPNADLSPTTSASSFSSGAPLPSSPKYIVAGLDLDPPFPSFPVMGPLLHSMCADLKLIMDTECEGFEEGFLRLESEEGGEVAGYMGPAPPGLGGSHRYVFMCWEQPEGMDGERIREEMGLGEEGMGMMGRVRWDQEGFERRLGLREVVARNYFVC